MDTVLIGGLAVLGFFGILYIVHTNIEKSSLSPKVKRFANYGIILLIIASATWAIDWHAEVWLATR